MIGFRDTHQCTSLIDGVAFINRSLARRRHNGMICLLGLGVGVEVGGRCRAFFQFCGPNRAVKGYRRAHSHLSLQSWNTIAGSCT
eukprot:scaffold277564_cov30-Tisochrysis_lutea.AAC.2